MTFDHVHGYPPPDFVTGNSPTVTVTPHTACQRGRYEDNYPHDFRDVRDGMKAGQPLIYCTQCGEVRKLEVEP